MQKQALFAPKLKVSCRYWFHICFYKMFQWEL